jgi:hypothetical protein
MPFKYGEQHSPLIGIFVRREVTLGCVSWINSVPTPVYFGASAFVYEPAWVPKTYIGLAATANADPGDRLPDFTAFRGSRDFRALMYCRIAFDLDATGGRISDFQVLDAVHDPGFTPPFRMRAFPSTVLSFDTNIYSNSWYPGEASPLSLVNTQTRHTNTAIGSIAANETVLVNGVIKFRAGTHTDNVGVNSVKCPYHVPWVWSEVLLTWAAGRFKLYGRGSIFPSHSWYLNGERVAKFGQVGDLSLPRRQVAGSYVKNLYTIAVEQMQIYPVLSAGASATGPQRPPSLDVGLTTPIDGQPNTVRGAPLVTVG